VSLPTWVKTIVSRPADKEEKGLAGLLIRPAEKHDVPALDLLQRSAPGAVLWEPDGYLSYPCRVAEWKGKVVGFVVMRTLGDLESEVLSLVVGSEYRRRGIGRRLMTDLLDHSHQTWFLEVRESNLPAIRLYAKLGFEEVAKRGNYYQDTGETAIVMRRRSW